MENTKKKVLVIDDEAHIRRVIALKLQKRGYEVMMASNGEEGLEMIKRQEPNVVITDIMMPKLDGRTLCEQTNDLKKDRPFLTIVITCRVSPNEQLWIEDMRDAVFMEKPFSPTRLVDCVDQYFGAER